MKFLLRFLALTAFLFVAHTAQAEETAPAPAHAPAPAPASPQQATDKPAARREDVEPKTLTEARSSLKQARADRDAAEQLAEDEQAAHEQTKTALAAAQAEAAGIPVLTQERDDARAAQQASEDQRLAVIEAVAKSLNLTSEQANAISTDSTIIPAAIDRLAQEKAVAIAAAQGVPPVPKVGAKAEPTTITRSEFDAMRAEARNDFIRNGGKVTD